MCSINLGVGSIVGFMFTVIIAVAVYMWVQQQPTITFEQQAHSPRDKNLNGASHGQGSWYMGGANTALQKLKDVLHIVKVRRKHYNRKITCRNA